MSQTILTKILYHSVKTHKIELFLATNDETPDQETVKHLKDVWRILKKLSDLYFLGTDEKKRIDLRQDSPPLQPPTKQQQSLVNDLHRVVYKHSYLKLHRRQEKYLKVIRGIRDLLHDKDSKDKEDSTEKEQFLQDRMLRLIGCLGFYVHDLGEYHHANWNVNEDQMSRFTGFLGAILDLANTILAAGDVCERWTDEPNCESEP